ncbi:MAG: SprT family zinc-dependent metalloprotease [Candidatus Gracilibacteria bacterium]|nr:SprT family zinc-dependent metalloprotease [Candidatus Gracilibacteria bacterium]
MNCQNQVLTLHEILYGTKIISFSLQKLERKTLRIEVLPTKETIVKAPNNISTELILERVKKRAGWILKQIEYFNNFIFTTSSKKYISGETFLYLGRQYILKTEIVQKNETVKLKGKFLTVYVKKVENTEKILNQWYLKNAQEKFTIYSKKVLEQFEQYNVKPTKISIRTMKTRWGSCSKKGNITLNSELIKAPRGCIEYVLIHEMSHLIEFGHTKAFYDLQTKEMPDRKKWKNKLEKLLA